jgi:hypothetical protein
MKGVFGVAAAALCSLALAAPASAGIYEVDTNVEGTDFAPGDGVCETATGNGVCPLRAAIEETNAATIGIPSPDVINFSGSATHAITSTLSITDALVIDGTGSTPAGTVIDGDDSFRLFETASPAVTLENVRLQDGRVNSDFGAAIEFGGPGTLSGVVITSNEVTGVNGFGGAVFGGGTLNVANSTVSDTTMTLTGDGLGAGIYSVGALSLTDSTVSGNEVDSAATAQGGGIYHEGAISITRSTISGNSAVAGAGVFDGGITAGARTLTNSTISGNSAGNGGGGGIRVGNSSWAIESSTFAGNSTTGVGGDDVLVSNGGTATVRNTILASSAFSCGEQGSGSLVSQVPGNNIDTGTSCGFDPGTDDSQQNVPVANLALGALAVDPPATTATHALGPTSAALDAGADAACTAAPVNSQDQRGVARLQGPGCDVGAFELEYHTLTVNTGGTGSGSVAGGTEIDCPGVDCTELVPEGSGVVLTASPDPGSSSFDSWTGCDDDVGNQCTQTLFGDETVTATFDPIPRTLTVTKAGTGTGTVSDGSGIDCGMDCDQVLPHGSMTTLTATPAAGSTFAGWTGCDLINGNQCTQTLSGPGNEIVTASFNVPPASSGGQQQAADNSAECAALRKKLRKAKSKKAKKKIRKQIRNLGC